MSGEKTTSEGAPIPAGANNLQNHNNWHWVEKNADRWSKDVFEELFTGIEVTRGPVNLKFTGIKSSIGEARANNRKAKLIFLYEWVIKVNFIATVTGFDAEYKGEIEIPNLSDENTADEIDCTSTVETKGPHESDIKSLINKEGTALVQKQCAIYINRLKTEFSKGLIFPVGPIKEQIVIKGKSSAVDKKSFQNTVVQSGEEKKQEVVTGPVEVTTFTAKDSFRVSPDNLWKLVFEKENVARWSNSNPTQYDFKENGAFNLLNGQISGTFTKITENDQVDCKWRIKSYPGDHHADVNFKIVDQGDSSDLIITCNNVPKAKYDETKVGLERYYLQFVGRTFMCSMSTVY
uniref:Aha1_N domain-containing protein n=1 Tax=Rhabditophanes sp. KR3021 TaxID=114890 RepID=A0AC35TTP8_9BILA